MSFQDIDYQVRDRLLLYARSLNVSSRESIELVSETLKRCTKQNPNYEDVLEILYTILAERNKEIIPGDNKPHLESAPAMQRSSMVTEELDRTPWITLILRGIRNHFGRFRKREFRLSSSWKRSSRLQKKQKDWERVAGLRRFLLLILILVPSCIGAFLMYSALPQGIRFVQVSISALFAILFCWISIGFWMCIAGIWLILRKKDYFSPSLNCDEITIPDDVRTAILFPVYNEDAKRYMAGIAATWHSLIQSGESRHFDIFILSDSTNPDSWVAEEEAWYSFCRDENAFGHIFYRRRRNNTKRKSGNVADFCRRWGVLYKYMIVFDADSVMRGKTMVKMVKSMEKHPEIGIIQTAPNTVNSHSLISRVQQFANHAYGQIFATGMHFWLLGDAQYWGHNAIIRVAPFIKHCQLPTLPGRGPLSGDILSHDFVESALMRRAGYGVWLAYDLEGSWEESPPSLIDELIRDRRWCQGNLQHSRLIFSGGIFPTHRALFVNGIMSYASALLWFFFLVFSSVQALSEILIPPAYFPKELTIFPIWPILYSKWILVLLTSTGIMLFLPKLLTIFLILYKGESKKFGGVCPLCIGVMGEVLISTFLAPIRMLFHSFFVVTTLLGWKVSWNTQNRRDKGTSWSDAIRFHWWGTLLGIIWGGLMWIVNPGFFLWFSPIAVSLALSIPISVLTSRVSWGKALRKCGMFITESEIQEEPEQEDMHTILKADAKYTPFNIESAFIQAVVVPQIHALHIALIRRKKWKRPIGEEREKIRQQLLEKALSSGPLNLTKQEKSSILMDPSLLHELHRKVWGLAPESGKKWGIVQP